MRYSNPRDSVYAPNSYGGPAADPRYAEPGWHMAGEIVRAAYTRRRDDDFSRPGTLYRTVLTETVLTETDRKRLVTNVSNHLRTGRAVHA